MSELRIESRFGPWASAVVQLVDEELAVRQQPLNTGGSASFDVGEGSYLVRALWSDGRKTQQVIEVPSAGASIGLEAPTPGPAQDKVPFDPASPTSIVASATRNSGLDEYPFWRPPPSRRRGAATDEVHDHVRQRIERDLVQTSMVLQGPVAPSPRLWRAINRTWERTTDFGREDVDGGFDLRLDVGDGLHLLEVRSGSGRQFLALPAERSIASIRSYRSDSLFYIGADVRTADDGVEALRSYIQNGELAVARAVAPEVMAERFLQAKVAAPRVAALGAYFLLRIGDLERLHNWPDNLTRWKVWLPDGPVIAAWQRLRSESPNYDEAFELLMEASRRGLPVYTEGVRLLKDGLELFANDDERVWPVADALKELDRYGKAMNWNKSETTYFGDAPDQPRLGARVGR